ncbi:hypothetical protein [Nodularia chucula]
MSKEQGITVTSVIIEALNQKFGKPDSQKTRIAVKVAPSPQKLP